MRVASPGRISDPGPGSPNLLLYTGPGLMEPPPAPPGGGPCPGVTNAENYPVNDYSTAMSPVVVSGCPGNASTVSTVSVWIVHTFIADLAVELVAPDGSVYPLQVHDGGPTQNIGKTFTVDLSSETADGLWHLRVQDRFPGDTGYIDNWTLDL